jgi:antirestriction protein ArdC
MSDAARKSAYSQAAEAIISQLEQGTIPWRKPWTSTFPTNATTKKAYRGMNVILLALRRMPSPYWLTYRQAAMAGGHVLAGEKGTPILFFSRYTKSKKNEETGEEERSRYGFWKSYTVFNISQCNPELKEKLGLVERAPQEDIPAAEAIWFGYKNAPTLVNDEAAWYMPADDTIGMPAKTRFNQIGEYYSTLFHEMGHSTGAAKRLNRDGLVNRKGGRGGEDYSQEELVAEFCSAMLCGMCGLEKSILDNQTAYIKNWLNRLRTGDGNKFLISAVSQAQKACDHILGAVQSAPVEQEVAE